MSEKVDAVKRILERTFLVPVSDCDAKIVLERIEELQARDAEQRRVPDPAEQKCPICHGEGEVFDVVTASVQECDACDGWGISERSAGG